MPHIKINYVPVSKFREIDIYSNFTNEDTEKTLKNTYPRQRETAYKPGSSYSDPRPF